MNNRQPRLPTQEEKEQLAAVAVVQQHGSSSVSAKLMENMKEIVDAAFIAVYDDYSTGSPGWFGKVMSVIWDNGAEYYQVYAWNKDGQLERWEQSEELRQ